MNSEVDVENQQSPQLSIANFIRKQRYVKSPKTLSPPSSMNFLDLLSNRNTQNTSNMISNFLDQASSNSNLQSKALSPVMIDQNLLKHTIQILGISPRMNGFSRDDQMQKDFFQSPQNDEKNLQKQNTIAGQSKNQIKSNTPNDVLKTLMSANSSNNHSKEPQKREVASYMNTSYNHSITSKHNQSATIEDSKSIQITDNDLRANPSTSIQIVDETSICAKNFIQNKIQNNQKNSLKNLVAAGSGQFNSPNNHVLTPSLLQSNSANNLQTCGSTTSYCAEDQNLNFFSPIHEDQKQQFFQVPSDPQILQQKQLLNFSPDHYSRERSQNKCGSSDSKILSLRRARTIEHLQEKQRALKGKQREQSFNNFALKGDNHNNSISQASSSTNLRTSTNIHHSSSNNQSSSFLMANSNITSSLFGGGGGCGGSVGGANLSTSNINNYSNTVYLNGNSMINTGSPGKQQQQQQQQNQFQQHQVNLQAQNSITGTNGNSIISPYSSVFNTSSHHQKTYSLPQEQPGTQQQFSALFSNLFKSQHISSITGGNSIQQESSPDGFQQQLQNYSSSNLSLKPNNNHLSGKIVNSMIVASVQNNGANNSSSYKTINHHMSRKQNQPRDINKCVSPQTFTLSGPNTMKQTSSGIISSTNVGGAKPNLKIDPQKINSLSQFIINFSPTNSNTNLNPNHIGPINFINNNNSNNNNNTNNTNSLNTNTNNNNHNPNPNGKFSLFNQNNHNTNHLNNNFFFSSSIANNNSGILSTANEMQPLSNISQSSSALSQQQIKKITEELIKRQSEQSVQVSQTMSNKSIETVDSQLDHFQQQNYNPGILNDNCSPKNKGSFTQIVNEIGEMGDDFEKTKNINDYENKMKLDTILFRVHKLLNENKVKQEKWKLQADLYKNRISFLENELNYFKEKFKDDQLQVNESPFNDSFLKNL